MDYKDMIGKTIKNVVTKTHKELCESSNRYWCNRIDDNEVVELYITFEDDTTVEIGGNSESCCKEAYIYIQKEGIDISGLEL